MFTFCQGCVEEGEERVNSDKLHYFTFCSMSTECKKKDMYSLQSAVYLALCCCVCEVLHLVCLSDSVVYQYVSTCLTISVIQYDLFNP